MIFHTNKNKIKSLTLKIDNVNIERFAEFNCVRFEIPRIVNNYTNSILDKINTHSIQGI